MVRQKIGIFGALVAVGGVLAWRWAQRHRASQAWLNRDLSRWEEEGGTVASMADATQQAPAHSMGTQHAMANGEDRSTRGDAWPFPRG
jgi:predicted negative regulator of RcsB-dependent stress response